MKKIGDDKKIYLQIENYKPVTYAITTLQYIMSETNLCSREAIVLYTRTYIYTYIRVYCICITNWILKGEKIKPTSFCENCIIF